MWYRRPWPACVESGDKANKCVILASSTAVESDTGGLTMDEDVVSETLAGLRGQMMLRAELGVRGVQKEATLLRLGGLYGYGRHPIYSLSGRTGLKDPQKPVHLIHQKDCLNIITKEVEKKLKGETDNWI